MLQTVGKPLKMLKYNCHANYGEKMKLCKILRTREVSKRGDKKTQTKEQV